jgi:hypothetical protein
VLFTRTILVPIQWIIIRSSSSTGDVRLVRSVVPALVSTRGEWWPFRVDPIHRPVVSNARRRSSSSSIFFCGILVCINAFILAQQHRVTNCHTTSEWYRGNGHRFYESNGPTYLQMPTMWLWMYSLVIVPTKRPSDQLLSCNPPLMMSMDQQ